MKTLLEKLRVEDWVVVWVSIPLLALALLIPDRLPGIPSTLVGEVAWYNIALLFVIVLIVLYAGMGGSVGMKAVPKILTGDVNPSGRTVDVWPADFTKDPTWGNMLTNTHVGGTTVNIGTAPDGKALPTSVRSLDYEEGIYVGYKWYETAGTIDGWFSEAAEDQSSLPGQADDPYYNRSNGVLFPFGYGLSYTSFSWTMGEASFSGEITEAQAGDRVAASRPPGGARRFRRRQAHVPGGARLQRARHGAVYKARLCGQVRPSPLLRRRRGRPRHGKGALSAPAAAAETPARAAPRGGKGGDVFSSRAGNFLFYVRAKGRTSCSCTDTSPPKRALRGRRTASREGTA